MSRKRWIVVLGLGLNLAAVEGWLVRGELAVSGLAAGPMVEPDGRRLKESGILAVGPAMEPDGGRPKVSGILAAGPAIEPDGHRLL